MISLNPSGLTDDKLKDLAHKILEKKQMSVFSINSRLTKLKTYPNNFWSSIKVKMISTIGISVSAFGIIALAMGLYFKCF